MIQSTSSFNIRIYGILKDHNNRVLVSDELIRGNYFTKFPGGGLEIGEGTRDCLKREFKEETNLDVTIGDHIYTTDFFQQSAFNENHQIISIYYFVHTDQIASLKTSTIPFNFTENQKAYNQIYNVACGDQISLNEIISMLNKITGNF